MKKHFILIGFIFLIISSNYGQANDSIMKILRELQTSVNRSEHSYDILEKKIDDVNVLEVETLIRALKAEGKKFEYEIFKDIPGGHSFDRIDLKQSREIRLKIWSFIAKYLNPPSPMKNLKEMEKAAYVVVDNY